MSVLFRFVSRLIAIGAFALAVPTLASASDVEQTKGFKLAMGPTSAAQKNQSPATMANSDAVVPKPRPHIKRHRRHHHGR